MPKNGPSALAPSRTEILERVRALTPGFAERARAAEEARQLPDESVAEMVAAGLPRILIPRSRGGYGHGFETWFEVVREIAKADASHGWCASLMIHHAHYLSQCTAEAQDAVWADGPDAVIAASFAPTAEITPADGGFLVSGRSAFTSGIAHSGWVFIGGIDPTGAVPEWTFFLVSPGAYRVEDTWYTTGMRATGSNTVVTDNVFVPASHAVRLSDMREGKGPGAALHDGPIYRAPFIAYAPITFLTPMLGAAQGAYEHFRDWTKARTAVRGNAVAEFTSVQTRLARAAADLDAAELLMRRAIETVQGPDATALELRARSMRDFSRVSEIVCGAIDTLMGMSGAAGFAQTHPVQRAWRDIHFAAMHGSINPENNFAHFGRMELGLERDPQLPFF